MFNNALDLGMLVFEHNNGFLNNWYWITDSYLEKDKIELISHITITKNYKGIWEINEKAKSIQILEENMGEFFYN